MGIMARGSGQRPGEGLRMAAAGALLIVTSGSSAMAADISIGAGARTSFSSTDVDGTEEKVNDFVLNNMRLYTSGPVNDFINFTFNTEYQGSPPAGSNDVEVLDAIARFEFSPAVNFWMGRFLPPSDRANLYGAYYANHWGFVTDGVQDGFPFVAGGRNNGIAYWGNFGIANFSIGAFDVPSTTGDSDLVTAARLHLSFWDVESGYYLNGTYYGDKDIFSIGVAGHNASGDNAITADILIEKKLPGGGVMTFEGEYANYDGFGGYTTSPTAVDFSETDGYFGLLSYLFPPMAGPGRIQLLGKYAANTLSTAGGDIDQTTTELNLGYVIEAFDARVALFYIDTGFDEPAGPDFTQIGLGLQIQM